MNAMQRGLEKAKRRERKTGKKYAGKTKANRMVVHGRPVERLEVDRATESLMTRSGRSFRLILNVRKSIFDK